MNRRAMEIPLGGPGWLLQGEVILALAVNVGATSDLGVLQYFWRKRKSLEMVTGGGHSTGHIVHLLSWEHKANRPF